jgi:hypothetical protein
MAIQKPDSPNPVPTPKPGPAPRSEALEAELAMLEAILPTAAESSAQPTRVDSPKDRGDIR